jgi:hypothetical protein
MRVSQAGPWSLGTLSVTRLEDPVKGLHIHGCLKQGWGNVPNSYEIAGIAAVCLQVRSMAALKPDTDRSDRTGSPDSVTLEKAIGEAQHKVCIPGENSLLAE